MNDIVKNILVICGGISILIAALYAMRKFWRAVRPIKIVPSILISMDGSKRNNLSAKITNRSEETLFIIECFARESKPLKYSLFTHLAHPLIKPSLYSCVWWGIKKFQLLNTKQHKLEAGETVELKYELDFNPPLAGFSENQFRVIVKLSTGRKVMSHRLSVPNSWLTSSL